MTEDTLNVSPISAFTFSKSEAKYISRWFGLLFWIFIPNFLGRIMNVFYELLDYTDPFIIGDVLKLGSFLMLLLSLIMLGRVNKFYFAAAACYLINEILTVFYTTNDIMLKSSGQMADSLLIAAGVLLIALVGTYFEYTSHSNLLRGVNESISKSWKSLIKWHISLNLSFFACMFFMTVFRLYFLSVPNIIIMFAFIFVGLSKIMLLKQTADAFKAISNKKENGQ